MYPVVFKLAVSAAFGMECKTHCYLTFTVLLLVYMNGWMVYFIEQHFSSSKDVNKGSIEALFLSIWRIQVVLADTSRPHDSGDRILPRVRCVDNHCLLFISCQITTTVPSKVKGGGRVREREIIISNMEI